MSAEEDLTATGRGKISVGRSYNLKRTAIKVAEGRTRTLKLKPKRRARVGIAKALELRRGPQAVAKLTVRLTDGSGNTVAERLRVQLKP